MKRPRSKPPPLSVPRAGSLLHRLLHITPTADPPHLDQLMIFLDDPPPGVRDRWKQGAKMCSAGGIPCTGPSVWRLYRSHVLEWRVRLAAEASADAAEPALPSKKKWPKWSHAGPSKFSPIPTPLLPASKFSPIPTPLLPASSASPGLNSEKTPSNSARRPSNSRAKSIMTIGLESSNWPSTPWPQKSEKIRKPTLLSSNSRHAHAEGGECGTSWLARPTKPSHLIRLIRHIRLFL